MCNSSQSNFNLLSNHIYAEIEIIPAMDTDPLRCQYDRVV